MNGSVVFDRAVPYYDKTRANPDWIRQAITDSIVREMGLTHASRVLEIGIGTGRIALPLLERNLGVVGVDLSYGMMNELCRKAADRPLRLLLAQCDAEQLPFADAIFDGLYAVHVFHLVAGWQTALNEAFRVLKPGGRLLVSYHRRDPESVNRRLRNRLTALVADQGVATRRPGAQSNEELAAEIERWAVPRPVAVATWREATTIARILDELAEQIYSETWYIPAEIMRAVMPALREWAQREFGDLQQSVGENAWFDWLVAIKPGPGTVAIPRAGQGSRDDLVSGIPSGRKHGK